MSQSLYDLLQVSVNAESEIIEAAYKLKLTKLEGKFDEDSLNNLKLIQWAYQTLINADKRSQYDKSQAVQQTSSSYVETGHTSVFMDWWSTNKVTGTLIAIALLAGASLFLNYKKETTKIDVSKIAVQEDSQNNSKHLDNESMAVSGTFNNQKQGQEMFKAELTQRANERAQALDMAQQRQEQQLEMQREQLALQKQRQDQQTEQQKQQIEQQRIQKEQRYYACYNAAWDRFAGDSARANVYCSSFR